MYKWGSKLFTMFYCCKYCKTVTEDSENKQNLDCDTKRTINSVISTQLSETVRCQVDTTEIVYDIKKEPTADGSRL